MVTYAWMVSLPNQSTTQPSSPVVSEKPGPAVLVTSKRLPRGHILRPDDLTWQVWPADSIDPRYTRLGSRPLDAFGGWVTRSVLGPGEPIVENKIVSPGDQGFLAAALHPGMRAVSIPTNALMSASGLILPGDRIDILLAVQFDDPGTEGKGKRRRAIQTLFENLEVIAVNQKIDGAAGEAIVGQSVTLEVSSKQAEVLALASDLSIESGNLFLVLRSMADDDPEVLSSDPQSGSKPEKSKFTIDNDVATLLPKQSVATLKLSNGTTILRGGAKSGASAPKGNP